MSQVVPITAAPSFRQEREVPLTYDQLRDYLYEQGLGRARRILQTLAAGHPMRLTRAQLGTLSKFKITGGTFQTYFSQLKRNGLIVEERGECWITQEGLDFLGEDVPAPKTTAEVRSMWRQSLKKGAREMLDVLIDHHPQGLARSELAELTGYTESGGTFQTYLSMLRRNGLAEVDGDQVAAGEALFLTPGAA